MHLDQPVVVGAGAVDDDEDEVVIAVDFGSLVKLLRVLDGERVELEDVPEDLEIVCSRLVEVEPEELVAGQELPDLIPVEVDLAAPLVVEDMAP